MCDKSQYEIEVTEIPPNRLRFKTGIKTLSIINNLRENIAITFYIYAFNFSNNVPPKPHVEKQIKLTLKAKWPTNVCKYISFYHR
jgi:hypothetical protein